VQERHAVFREDLVVTAYTLAAKAHTRTEPRPLDGSSQLAHGCLVALSLAELGLDAPTVAAGLLHEALRCPGGAGSGVARSQLEEFMPGRVMDLVDRVGVMSEVSSLYRGSRQSQGAGDAAVEGGPGQPLGEEAMRRSEYDSGDLADWEGRCGPRRCSWCIFTHAAE
jgi:(p)ppGpp synthase/HD superfamily hydrolase